jgi:hypothetical protein
VEDDAQGLEKGAFGERDTVGKSEKILVSQCFHTLIFHLGILMKPFGRMDLVSL